MKLANSSSSNSESATVEVDNMITDDDKAAATSDVHLDTQIVKVCVHKMNNLLI